MTKQTHIPHKGCRVQLRREYDCYPTGLWKAGTTGTVSKIDAETIMVTLDYTDQNLDEWSNAIQVWPAIFDYEKPLGETFWELFEYEKDDLGINDLTAEYTAWNKAQGLDLGSADEHMYDEDLTAEQQNWVQNFVERWECVEEIDRERDGFFEIAAAARFPDDEWGSEDQIEAQNEFCLTVEDILNDEEFAEFEGYCLKATASEMIDNGTRMVEAVFARRVAATIGERE